MVHEVSTTLPCVLLTSLSGQLGGMEFRLAEEARLLQRLPARPLLAVSRFPGLDAWLDSLRAEGLETVDFEPAHFFEQWAWRRSNLLLARWRDVRRLRRLAPALVHVAYAWTETGGSRLWLAAKAGVPAVIGVHNSFPRYELPAWSARLMRDAFANVRGIYGVSDSAVNQFMQTYGSFVGPRTAIQTIFNFVDTGLFRPSLKARAAFRRAFDIPQDALVVGSIGRIDVQKQPLAVLHCFAAATAGMGHAFLVFVGQGPMEPAVRAEVDRLGLGGRVRFAGFRRDPQAMFPGLDVHVLFSKQEGFGISTAEAMACGVPVVATDVPGTRDVFARVPAGVMVPFLDEHAAAHALRLLLLDDDRRQQLGALGCEGVPRHFGKPIWERDLADFYRRMLAA